MPFRSSPGIFGPALRPGSLTGGLHQVTRRGSERHGPAVKEAENRLDTVLACGIVSCAIDRGFPAGELGGRDASFDAATK